jgi:hypothetical protein
VLRTLAPFIAAGSLACLAAPSAWAVPPALLSVDQQSLHVKATFSAPKADDVTITMASSPSLATNGRFLQENIVSSDLLTDSEIQSGQYLAASQIDPGSYYVMLSALYDYRQCTLPDYTTDPTCANGMSNMLPLTVPAPDVKYRVTTTLLRNINILYLTLTATPLGRKQPYRMCWRNRTGRKRCLSETLDGYSWTSKATDQLRITTRGLARKTKFTWTTTDSQPTTLATRMVSTPTS